MTITTKTFTTLVSDSVAAIQAGASSLVDMTVGSVLRSIVEANAAMTLWIQGLILQLLAVTRAATSNGTDLDTFVADFGVTRLVAVAATGRVTFARFTSTNQATIALGTTVQTADGTQSYAVVADVTNTNFNVGLNAYIIPAGTGSASISVQAVTPGAGANVASGQINTLTSAVPYVDTVSNAANFTNGANAETDPALRARFVTFIANLSKATKSAVGSAIAAVQPGLRYVLVENQTYAGVVQLGYFFAVVDDGTGAPAAPLLALIGTAIDNARPLTSTFGLYSPVVVTGNVAMTVTVAAGYDPTITKAAVQSAITTYMNSLTFGGTMAYTKLLQLAYDASAGVTNVTGTTLNGGTADLTSTAYQVIKAGTVVVS
jgi:uncharacterized phage protein gp47/JayE